MKQKILSVLAMLFVAALLGGYATQAAEFVSPAGQKHQQSGVTCVNCHHTSKPTAAAPQSACVACHANKDGRYVGIGAKQYVGDGGAIKTTNPHQSHLVDLPCTECHKTHSVSVIYCNQCHLFKDMPVK